MAEPVARTSGTNPPAHLTLTAAGVLSSVAAFNRVGVTALTLQGGGQPSDVGTIESGGTAFDVESVKKNGDEACRAACVCLKRAAHYARPQAPLFSNPIPPSQPPPVPVPAAVADPRHRGAKKVLPRLLALHSQCCSAAAVAGAAPRQVPLEQLVRARPSREAHDQCRCAPEAYDEYRQHHRAPCVA